MSRLWDRISLSVAKLEDLQLNRDQNTIENIPNAILISISPKNTFLESFKASLNVAKTSPDGSFETLAFTKPIIFEPGGKPHDLVVPLEPTNNSTIQLRLEAFSDVSLDNTLLSIVFLKDEKYIVYEETRAEFSDVYDVTNNIPHLLKEILPTLHFSTLKEACWF